MFYGLPPKEVILELSPADLGGQILRVLMAIEQSENRKGLSYHNFTLLFREYPDIQLAVAEAWAWLENELLIVNQPGPQAGWYVISRRGRELKTEEEFEGHKRARVLPRENLNPNISKAVYSDFMRGEYDSAVFKAFKHLEVTVREVCGYDESMYGRTLMAKAFDPEKGPLTNLATVDVGERQALRDLFCGAVGSYKNPHSHRKVALDPREASEMIVLASHLLSIVQARSKVGNKEIDSEAA